MAVGLPPEIYRLAQIEALRHAGGRVHPPYLIIVAEKIGERGGRQKREEYQRRPKAASDARQISEEGNPSANHERNGRSARENIREKIRKKQRQNCKNNEHEKQEQGTEVALDPADIIAGFGAQRGRNVPPETIDRDGRFSLRPSHQQIVREILPEGHIEAVKNKRSQQQQRQKHQRTVYLVRDVVGLDHGQVQFGAVQGNRHTEKGQHAQKARCCDRDEPKELRSTLFQPLQITLIGSEQ